MRNLSKRLLAATAAATMLFGSVITANAAQEDLFDAQYYAEAYPDIAAAFGNDENALLQHYLNYGITEGRSASAYFNALAYKTANADLAAAFGDDWDAYADHYIQSGVAEGRYAGGTRALPDAEYAAAAEKLAEGADTDAAEEAQTTSSEAEADKTASGVYVEKKITYHYAPNFNSIQIYRLGGNSKYVWYDSAKSNRTVNEVAAEDYGVSLDDIDFVTRTDFADGLIDNDGNGIDDRDPINGMGFIDLNHNGIDDRQALTMVPSYTDGSHDTPLIGDYIGECYMCPHKILCSTANPYTSHVMYMAFLPSFYADMAKEYSTGYTVYLDVVCPICISIAYKCKSIGDKLDEMEAGNIAETVLGYEMGDTEIVGSFTMGHLNENIVVTYIGEDKWLRSDGAGTVNTHVSYKSGNSFEEIYSTRYLGFPHAN